MPIIFLQQYCCTQAVKSGGQLKIHSYHNQALYGFSYRNITASSMQECLQHCLSDCLCQTFQICGNTCQLCSNLTGSNAGQLNSTAIRENIGCNRFEFEHRNNLWVSYLTSISVLWGDLMTLYHYFVHSLILVLQLSNIFRYINPSGNWESNKFCGGMFLVSSIIHSFSYPLLPVPG